MTREEAIKVLRTESVEISGKALTVAYWLEAMDVAISVLRGQQWISVKDRLPEKPGDYLVYYTTTANNMPLISMRHFYGEIPGAFVHNKNMTHWMPLPEPPKEDYHEN